jgi:hypothetical protein
MEGRPSASLHIFVQCGETFQNFCLPVLFDPWPTLSMIGSRACLSLSPKLARTFLRGFGSDSIITTPSLTNLPALWHNLAGIDPTRTRSRRFRTLHNCFRSVTSCRFPCFARSRHNIPGRPRYDMRECQIRFDCRFRAPHIPAGRDEVHRRDGD